MTVSDKFYDEIVEVLQKHQPKLKAISSPNTIEISGVYVCKGPMGEFDQFDINISVPRDYPIAEPEVREVGGRIPHTVARHIYPSTAKCCLGHWVVWLLNSESHSFESYLLGHLASYFIGQSVFELTGEWPFGEEGHSKSEIATSYREALGLTERADAVAFTRLLSSPLLRGNPYCPCGSGDRLKSCHWSKLRALRQRFPPAIRKLIYKRVYERAEK
ncbi:MAG: hypothetical protein ABGW87_05295 [Sphingomonadaceae bacterium]